MLHITLGAGEQIINAQHLVSLFQQAVNKMGAEESGAARDQDTFAAIIESRHELGLYEVKGNRRYSKLLDLIRHKSRQESFNSGPLSQSARSRHRRPHD